MVKPALIKSSVWIIVTLVASIFLLIGALDIVKSAFLVGRGERSFGTISYVVGNRPSLAFTDRNGESHIFPIRHLLSSTLTDRQTLTVIYDPEDPKSFVIDSPLFQWVVGGVYLFGGLLVALLGALSIRLDPFRELLGLPLSGAGAASATPPEKTSKAKAQSNISPIEAVGSKTGGSLNVDREVMKNTFGPLRKVIDDPQVSDVIMAGPNSVFVKRGAKVTKSDITFATELQYDQFVDRLLTISDSTLSIAKPIMDGMLTPLIRIHGVHKALCEEGPYITLRVSRLNTVKFNDVLRSAIAPREVLMYLRALLLTGHTILIAGEVGTGKTTLIRALAATISTAESILVIEDTPEIKIEHPAVRYIRTRESNIEGMGKVSPAECIRAGMRMAMNRIIFGEIRDPEAAESFIDVCVSGHPGMSTIHARSASDAVARLELLLARQQAGVDRFALRQQIGSAVQVVVHTAVCRDTGQRRITEVLEVMRGEEHPLHQQMMFHYSVSNNLPVWKVTNRTSFFEGELREFEGGSTLANTPDWLTLPSNT